ncbi:hypothetical protein WN55_02712 [Dufourea novaeangliae]|uniref:Uncharacterized protein n=1 Tax=Dufourea novaeangliae TaxID=178035 RepID=A0A154NZQ8_DUFNO|nr:hypothetical protein WN55_02712 [Dufourea novaeangliae]
MYREYKKKRDRSESILLDDGVWFPVRGRSFRIQARRECSSSGDSMDSVTITVHESLPAIMERCARMTLKEASHRDRRDPAATELSKLEESLLLNILCYE